MISAPSCRSRTRAHAGSPWCNGNGSRQAIRGRGGGQDWDGDSGVGSASVHSHDYRPNSPRAREASGAAWPKPGDIALQQASRPDSPDRGKLRVFVSYSRDDLDFADQLDAALNAYGFECIIDRQDISGGEDWKRRLGNLISEADTVVFVLSPTSARSEICAWEVEEAARLGKRILPVNCRPLKGARPPPRLRDLQYIFFHADPKAPSSGFGTGLAKLVAALNTDFDWLREHTRYLQRATEWDRGGRPANRLLSGDDIADAKAWLARRPKNAPEPTALHLDFIRSSEEEAEARASAQRKQLEAMAAAQAERETALHEAEEALKQAADAQRKRATIRNIAFVVVSILAVLAGWLYWNAAQQRKVAEERGAVAEEQKKQADHILGGATGIIVELQNQMNDSTKKHVFAVFQTGADHGDAISMANLGKLYQYGHGVAQDYVKARDWYEKAAANGYANAMSSLGGLYENGQGVAQDYAKAREWYEKAAAKGDANAMFSLGGLYESGAGVAQDYAKAREWYEKGADKGEAEAMTNLGVLYEKGYGVTQNHAKAREWFEKAADKGEAEAMTNLGWLYQNGQGGAQDNAKARELYEKAADQGNARAMAYLEKLPIKVAAGAGRYAEALQLQEALAAKVEAVETEREGKPGEETAQALNSVAWYALFAREFTKALTVADRARALFRDDLMIETNRVHALMFVGRGEESKALYLAHKGNPLSEQDARLWERIIVEDFAEFRKAGLTHPMMADIEKELGVSP
jgi:TPR repeat protein